MKKKILLSTIFCVFIFSGISAKTTGQTTWKIQTGLNISKFAGDLGDGNNAKNKPGVHLSLIAMIPVSPQSPLDFSFHTGLTYNMYGAKYFDSENTTDYILNSTEKHTLHYLQIPIQIAYRHSFNKIAISAFTGPYMAIGIKGKSILENHLYQNGEKYSEIYHLTTFGINFQTPEYDEYESNYVKDVYTNGNLGLRRFDIGWGIGAGISFKKIYLGIQYDFGIFDILGNFYPEEYKVSNRNFSLSIGYEF